MKGKRFLKLLTTMAVALTLVLNAFAPAMAATSAKSNAKVTATKKVVKKAKKATKKVTKKATTKKATKKAAKKTETKKAEPTKAPAKDASNNDGAAVANGNAIYAEDFSKSLGEFKARAGSEDIKWVDKPGSDGKNGYVSIANRSAAWNGLVVDVTSKVKPGSAYTVTGWVKYTEGADTIDFKITQQKDGSSWPAITGVVTVKKGEWTKLTGTMTVDADTTLCEVYYETDSDASVSFLADTFSIEAQ